MPGCADPAKGLLNLLQYCICRFICFGAWLFDDGVKKRILGHIINVLQLSAILQKEWLIMAYFFILRWFFNIPFLTFLF